MIPLRPETVARAMVDGAGISQQAKAAELWYKSFRWGSRATSGPQLAKDWPQRNMRPRGDDGEVRTP